MSVTLDKPTFKASLHRIFGVLNSYKIFIFFIIVAFLYSYIIWRINVYAVASPTESEKTAATEHTKVPKINESIVLKMKNLKDNSVNVQTLFDSARNNPFSE